jgi:hypothetical protein
MTSIDQLFEAPADIDADSGILGVIDHGAGQSHLSLFTYNRYWRARGDGHDDHGRRPRRKRRGDSLAARRRPELKGPA